MPSPEKEQPKASALFNTSDLQEYKHWRSIRFDSVKQEDDPLLPTAYEYADFLEWKLAQLARYRPRNFIDSEDERAAIHLSDAGREPESAFPGFTLAEKCGHPVHPAHLDEPAPTLHKSKGEKEGGRDSDPIQRCPVCILSIHRRLINELEQKWLAVGGPWRTLPHGVTADDFFKAKAAFYKAKTSIINEMHYFESMADRETTWEAKHPNHNLTGVKGHDATKALWRYYLRITFPATLAEPTQIPPRTPRPEKSKKRLSYSPGTPDDTRHRSHASFARNSTAYDPNSPHACPDEDGWADTSLIMSWEHNVSQCRLLLCDRDPSLPDVTYRELTADKCKEHLLEGIRLWFGSMENPSWVEEWAGIFAVTTDVFVVWKTGAGTGGEDEFNNWDKIAELVGSNLEGHALRIGDVEEGNLIEYRALQRQESPPVEEMEEEQEDDDYFYQSSLASDYDVEDEECSGSTNASELEDDDDAMIVDVGVQSRMSEDTILDEDVEMDAEWPNNESDK